MLAKGHWSLHRSGQSSGWISGKISSICTARQARPNTEVRTKLQMGPASSSSPAVSFAESVRPSLLAPRVRAVGPAPQQATNLRVRNEAPANSAAGVRVPVPSASTSQSSTTYARVPAPIAPSRCKVVHATGSSAERHVEPLAVHTVFPPRNARSVEFWYPDGNIIISTGGTYFKLLLSRLSRHCGYFERIANDRARTMPVGGQRVVEVRDLELQDFNTFLRYLEIPM